MSLTALSCQLEEAMPKAKILSPEQAARVQPLDATTLGRPFHQLPLLMPLIEARVHEFVRSELSQRYRAALVLGSMRYTREVSTCPRWSWHRVGSSSIGVHIERPLLLRILDCRYGGRTAQTDAAQTEQPETETEFRLARMLGATLAPLLPEFIAQSCGDTPLPLPPAQHLPVAPGSTPVFALILQLTENDGSPCGAIRLSLDRDSLDRLLRASSTHLAPRPASASGTPGPHFGETLRLRLQARLQPQSLSLGEVLDLRVGQIIPALHPGSAHVHIGRSRLFRASVVEHEGRLCLTSFTDEE